MRNQWNIRIPWVPSKPIFLNVDDATLHPKPIIPIFSEIFFLTPKLSCEMFGIFYIEIMIDKDIAKRLQNIIL